MEVLASNETFSAPMDSTYAMLDIDPASVTTLESYLQEYYQVRVPCALFTGSLPCAAHSQSILLAHPRPTGLRRAAHIGALDFSGVVAKIPSLSCSARGNSCASAGFLRRRVRAESSVGGWDHC